MNHHSEIENLIDRGRTELHDNQNKETARKIFMFAKTLDPQGYNKLYLDFLLGMCKNDKDENTCLEDLDIEKEATSDENVGPFERGGREAIYETPNYRNLDENCSIDITEKGTLEILGRVTEDISNLKKNHRKGENVDLLYDTEVTNSTNSCGFCDCEGDERAKNRIGDSVKMLPFGSKENTAEQQRKKLSVYEESYAGYDKEIKEIAKLEQTTAEQNECKDDKFNEFSEIKTEQITNVKPFTNQNESEIELNSRIKYNSFQMRSYVIQMGIKVFGSIPNYRPEVNFEMVELTINDYILRARNELHLKRYNDCEFYITEAEKMYSGVAIILPQASIRKNTTFKPNNNTSNSENNDNSASCPDSITKSVSYKEFVKGDNIDVIKCLTLAEAALTAKDYKKAERLIKKANRIFPTKNASELFKKLEMAQRKEKEAAELAAQKAAELAAEMAAERAAELASQKAAEAAAQKAAELAAQKAAETVAQKAAELAAQKAKEIPAQKHKHLSDKESKTLDLAVQKTAEIDIKLTECIDRNTSKDSTDLKNWNNEILTVRHATAENIDELEAKVIDKPAAKECMQKAKSALDCDDFDKADRFLLKAKRLDPEINISLLQGKVRAAIASRSSSIKTYSSSAIENDDAIIQPTNDKKRNSKECCKLANDYLKTGDTAMAEKLLIKAQKLYNSKQVREMLDNIQKSKDVQNLNLISEPSFVHSYSENNFAYNPSQEDMPSNHLASVTFNEIEEYLKKGRYALTCGKLETAELYALKCKELSPVRAQGLLHDINKLKEMRQQPRDGLTLRSGRILCEAQDRFEKENTATNVVQNIEKSLAAAEIEYSLGNIDEAFKILNMDGSIQSDPRGKLMYEKLQEMRVKSKPDLATVHKPSKSGDNVARPESDNWKDKRDNVEQCIIKAEEANFENDFETADHYLQKAYRICPDEEIMSMIAKVQHQKKQAIQISPDGKKNQSEEQYRENQREAKRCLIIAEEAYNAGEFNRAERMFAKAYRMDPSDYTHDFIIKLRREKDKMKVTENSPEMSKNQSRAEDFTNHAMDAIHSDCYFVAENWLKKAYYLFPNEATKQLMDNVRDKIQQYEQHLSEKKALATKQRQLKSEAQRYYKMAEAKFQSRDLDSAQSLALISDSLLSSGETRQLFKRIFDHKYNAENDWKTVKRYKDKYIKSYTCFKSERYMEIAKNAIELGDFKLAEEYLIHSNKIYFTPEAYSMLIKVQDSLEKGGQETSHSNKGWVQKGTCWFRQKFL